LRLKRKGERHAEGSGEHKQCEGFEFTDIHSFTLSTLL
jgi:hypothetical protein